MNKLLSTTVLAMTIAFSGTAFANSQWYGKEGQDEKTAHMEKALSRLPAAKAHDFRSTMKAAREDNKELQDYLYKLHNDLHGILVAPEFDKRAFLMKRSEIQQAHAKMESNRTEAFASAVDELSQQERITLTRALHHDKPKHWKKTVKAAPSPNVPTTAGSTDSIEH